MNSERVRVRKPSVVIASIGRFHVLDLARELHRLGYDVVFISALAHARVERFGLPRRCHRSLRWWLAPLLLLSRLVPSGTAKQFIELLIFKAANLLTIAKMPRCEIFIGMAGIHVAAGAFAKRRFGAKFFLERGSRHILSQKEILDAISRLSPRARSVSRFTLPRDIAGYDSADLIVVPAAHAEESFLVRGTPKGKIFRNPYGVDLEMFTRGSADIREYDLVLFVGAWSFQKGVDVLSAACRSLPMPFRLVHVGAVADAPFPTEGWFRSHGPVDQSKLKHWYARAAVMVLPSRQEGLALVMAQALACDCPVVATSMTGANDLAELLDAASMIDVIPAGDAPALSEAIARRLGSPGAMGIPRNRMQDSLSWKAYGARYAAKIDEVLGRARDPLKAQA